MGVSITINIDDESRFKDIISKELDALKLEELHDIVIDAIKEMLHTNDNEIIKGLLVREISDIYTNRHSYEPTTFMYDILKSFDYSEGQEIANDIINELRTNYRKLAEEVMLTMIINGMTDNYIFRDNIKKIFIDIYRDMHNN